MRIDSQCRHCSQPIAFEVDEQLRYRVLTRGTSPLLFEPDTDWGSFHAPNIIHDY